MQNIQIIDDFFDAPIFDEIIHKINKQQYVCKCIHNHNSDKTTDIPFWRCDLNDDLFFVEYLSTIIKTKLEENYYLKRVYLIGQTYQQNSNYHKDSNLSTSITICLYMNDIDIGGHLYIKIPNQKAIMAVEPKMNRVVIFPSIYRHKGVGIENEDLRKCIAWKFDNSSKNYINKL
uniref:Prolyl 4-hydroxylase alpha subunit Fe(2+) 2OG dioxygenase domain-containing protein n=1 Tax=viral metagenome TaxID=1070528 RepID=A0A6C0HBX9_9ZZZZ